VQRLVERVALGRGGGHLVAEPVALLLGGDVDHDAPHAHEQLGVRLRERPARLFLQAPPPARVERLHDVLTITLAAEAAGDPEQRPGVPLQVSGELGVEVGAHRSRSRWRSCPGSTLERRPAGIFSPPVDRARSRRRHARPGAALTDLERGRLAGPVRQAASGGLRAVRRGGGVTQGVPEGAIDIATSGEAPPMGPTRVAAPVARLMV
jgi:hypothetical protein